MFNIHEKISMPEFLIFNAFDYQVSLGLCQAHILSVLRAIKANNPGDMYYEAYQGHMNKWGNEFTDIYMAQFVVGKFLRPTRILEIGVRTGISLCQLLSAYEDHSVIESIDLVDPFDDEYISPNIVRSNLKYLGLPVEPCMFHQGYSQHVLPDLIKQGKKYDYILVDGDHSHDQAYNDLCNAQELLDDKGIILFDDISEEPGECALLSVWKRWVDKVREERDDYVFNYDIHGKGVAWAMKGFSNEKG